MTEPEMLHVLVIGATGSIGRLVVERLVQGGDSARALSRHPDQAQQLLGADVEVVSGDVSDPSSLRSNRTGGRAPVPGECVRARRVRQALAGLTEARRSLDSSERGFHEG